MNTFTLKAQDARRIATALSCCISTESTRYYLHGICIENSKEGLYAVSTDGHRLGHLKLQPVDSEEKPVTLAKEFSEIITLDAVKWLAKLSPRSTEPQYVLFEINKERSRIKFTLQPDNLIAEFGLIDGTFPDWRRTVPRCVDATTSFNPKYLSEISLAALRSGERRAEYNGLTLCIDDRASPAIINTGVEGLSYVLMPMRGDDTYFTVDDYLAKAIRCVSDLSLQLPAEKRAELQAVITTITAITNSKEEESQIA